MNKMILSLAIVIGLLTLGVSAFAADATANATATIQTGIGILKTSGKDLKFGTMVPGAASTVVVDADSVRTRATGDVVLVTDTSNNPQAAAFEVTGSPSTTFVVTLPTTCTITNARVGHTSETMTVTNFTSNAGTTLSALGAALFNVGGTLNVGAAQGDGMYTGTFSVTVAY